MAKVKISMVVLLFAIISVVVIVDYAKNHHGLSEQQMIFDDLDIIVQDYDSYSYLTKKGRNIGNTSDLEFEFSGMDTIWSIKAKNDGVLHVRFQSVITDGEFKVLLITPNHEIVTILNQSIADEKNIQIPEGTSKIKLVGRNAKGKLKMTLTANQWLNIMPINN